MAVATIDTLKYANALKASGMPDKQADAQTAALQDVFKTALQDVPSKDEFKSAIAELVQEIALLRQEMKAGFELMQQEMKNQADQLRHEMKESEQRQKNELKQTELRLKGELVLHRWMLGTVGMGILMVIARVYIFKTLF